MTNGMQNHVRFLMSLQVCSAVRIAKTNAAITPPAIDGVYGHSTYAGLSFSAMTVVGRFNGACSVQGINVSG